MHDEPADARAELAGDVLLQVGELDEVAVGLLAEIEAVGIDDELDAPSRSQKSSMLTHGM